MRTMLATLALAAVVAAQDARPAYLGVSLAPVDADTRAHFQLDDAAEAGALILEVRPGTAAAAAGVRAGDVIVEFDGKPIATMDDLIAAVRARRAGDTVGYALLRRDGRISGSLKLGDRPAEPAEPQPMPAPTPAPAPAQPTAELDRRLDGLETELAALRARLLAARREQGQRPPQSLGGWIELVERGLAAAKAARDEERARWHIARLSVLKEMRDAGTRMPPPPADRIERKLDEILDLLRRARE
jgi:membrane-associated protease RseP (regulator of RpoE activity)